MKIFHLNLKKIIILEISFSFSFVIDFSFLISNLNLQIMQIYFIYHILIAENYLLDLKIKN